MIVTGIYSFITDAKVKDQIWNNCIYTFLRLQICKLNQILFVVLNEKRKYDCQHRHCDPSLSET